MAIPEILNCAASGEVDLDTRCPVGWEAMPETGCTDQRRCAACGRRVFRCVNGVDATLRIANDEVIAVPEWLAAGVRRRSTIVIQDGHRYAHRVQEALEERLAEGDSIAFEAPPAANDDAS